MPEPHVQSYDFSILNSFRTEATLDAFESARTRAIEFTWTVVSLLNTPISPDDLAFIMALIGIPESETLNTVYIHTVDGAVQLPPHRSRESQCAAPAFTALLYELEPELNKRVEALLQRRNKPNRVKALYSLRQAMTIVVLQRIAVAKAY
jgi:hypothetical protein